MSTILLDLEETVIDCWSSRNLLPQNIAKIKNMLLDGDRLGIFSWAVWDQDDLADFNKNLRDPLEQVLGAKFDDRFLFSMDQISDIVLFLRNKKLSRDDLFDMFGKEECLLALFRGNYFEDLTVCLVDDKVDHGLLFTDAKTDRMMIFSNIDEMPNV